MKKQLLTLSAALLSMQCIYAQTNPGIETEQWADKPVIHTLTDKYSKEPAVIVSDKKRIEYVDDKKDGIAEYYTLHKIIHINDDRGIEEFNKIYLGISENADIVDVKARTVLPGGKIIELDKKDIKEIKENDGGVYKIFAMVGLEKGCDVEYLYTFRKPASYFGHEIVQTKIPVLQTSFRLVYPARLKFDIKPYNFSVTPTDTVIDKKRYTECNVGESPAAEDEKYAAYDANLRRLEFKLSYNDNMHPGERLFTWNELAKRIYALYTGYTDSEYKRAVSLATDNGWDKLTDETQEIVAVENYIKSHIAYNEDLKTEDGNKLDKVLHNKIGGAVGIVRLYAAIFQDLGVNYQFVLTGDRSKFIIDKAFENWDNCDDPIFYFPAEKKFLVPTRVDYRYPWIVPDRGEANGLFCKRTTLGSFTSAVAEVKPILLEDYAKSVNNVESNIVLSSGLDSLTIDSKMIMSGYAAVGYRDAFNYSNDDQKRTMYKEFAKGLSSSENLLQYDVTNPEFEKGTTNDPLIIHVKTKSGELVERAGNKLLIKIGSVIGPQTEMYQEKPRQEPI